MTVQRLATVTSNVVISNAYGLAALLRGSNPIMVRDVLENVLSTKASF